MTTGYLMLDQPNPNTPQGTHPRRGTRGKLTGTCILHTTEGAWTAGVQSLVNLVRTRADYGCYHRACDWQDIALLYPWEWETWQDSETNNWAVGISAACRTTDWATMPADVREGYYRNMARMAADFVIYMRDTYGITVPLKRITGDQARAGVPGFCAHGDSGLHRSDPGADFDYDTFFTYTAQALAGTDTKEWYLMPEIPKDNLIQIAAAVNNKAMRGDIVKDVLSAPILSTDGKKWPLSAHVQGNTARTVEALARIAGLEELVKQVAAGAGTEIDYARIEASFNKSLAENTVKVAVTVEGATTAEAPVV